MNSINGSPMLLSNSQPQTATEEVTLFGAANEVTGSCYLVETNHSKILVDCGLFQGSEKLQRQNKIPRSLPVKNIEAVVLTHGHLDHCGRLPLLHNAGYRGPIFATPGTIDIAKIILADAAHIQENDTARLNRRRLRSGLPPLKPLFNKRDAERVLSQFCPAEYGQRFKLTKDLSFDFLDAGHILGSSSIELYSGVNADKKIVFSGDIGQYDVPIMRNPATVTEADVVFLESTYGNRDHKSVADTVQEFRRIICQAVELESKVIIPTFAVGRAQLILFYLAEMFRNKVVKPIPIYLDSPMAIAASRAYIKHAQLFDAETVKLASSGQLEHDLATLVTIETPEQSMALNSASGPCVILAGAGMCNAGRVLHHLRHNLWRQNCCVVIVGYQARGSLGRLLVENADRVKIFGETITVKANVQALGGFSAHAGQSDLLRWLEPMVSSEPKLIFTHGENFSLHQLAAKVEENFGVHGRIPKLFETLKI